MDQEFFFSGKTVDEFLADFGDQRIQFEQLLAESAFSADQQNRAQELPEGWHILVIAEPWSGDVMYNLPPLIKLAEASGWHVRIFPRDQYPDLILPYLKEGLYRSIPVFVFYDQDFNELGSWIERPAEATKMIDAESLKLRRRLREEFKEDWRQETFEELLSLSSSGR